MTLGLAFAVLYNGESVSETSSERGQEIWLDTIADRFGFDVLADRVGVSSAMLFVASVIFVDTFVLEVGRYLLTGGRIGFVENPFVIIGEGGGALLIAVYGIRRLNYKYENAKIRLQVEQRLSNEKAKRFEGLGSRRLRLSGWVFGAGFQILQAVFLLGPAEIYRLDGIVGLFGNFVFIPFVYVPVIVDFAITYFSIQVILPRYIKNSGLGLDFLDPENMGGLRPIGELLKESYYYFVLLYASAALFIYGPELFPEMFSSVFAPGLVTNIVFTAVWMISAVLLAYGIFTLHVFMREEKKKEIQRLDQRVKKEVEKPWDIHNFRIPDASTYNDIRERMEYVTATREYPGTFTIWSQMLISILIPKALQMILSAT